MKFKNKSDEIIPIAHFPAYIRDDIIQNYVLNPQSIKSGCKSGKKLSDPDQKWVEKWFEIEAKDLDLVKNIANKIIVKYYTKFWTNVDENII